MLNSLTISCRITGIQGSINLPAVEGRNAVLQYTHPLSHIDSVISVVDEGMKYLRNLDTTVLAGMYIATLRYLGALQTKCDAAFINAELSKAPKGTLIHSLKAIVSYVVPASQHSHGIRPLRIAFEAPLENTNDAKLFIQSITTNLLTYHLDCDDLEAYAKGLANADTKSHFVSPYAFADRRQLAAMLDARQAAKDALAADQLAAAEKLRIKKKERAASAAEKGTYHIEDLYYSEAIDACAVELHIENYAISRSVLRNKLIATFERLHKKVIKRLPLKTNALLRQVGKTLDTMPVDRMEALVAKMSESTNAIYLADLARVVQLIIMVEATDKSDSILDDLDAGTSIINTEAVGTVTLSLKERLAKLGGKK